MITPNTLTPQGVDEIERMATQPHREPYDSDITVPRDCVSFDIEAAINRFMDENDMVRWVSSDGHWDAEIDPFTVSVNERPYYADTGDDALPVLDNPRKFKGFGAFTTPPINRVEDSEEEETIYWVAEHWETHRYPANDHDGSDPISYYIVEQISLIEWSALR